MIACFFYIVKNTFTIFFVLCFQMVDNFTILVTIALQQGFNIFRVPAGKAERNRIKTQTAALPLSSARCIIFQKEGCVVRLERLPTFIDLYETRSYTKTAQKNFISQTSVTQFINGLEEEFQVKLFDRTTLPIQPTAAGKQFYRDAKLLLQQYERMKSTLPRLEEAAQAEIRLCYTSKIDLQILLPFVRMFKKSYPQVAFHVEECSFRDASQLLWIRKCDAAVGIDFEPEYTTEMATLVLYEGAYQALVPSTHPLFEREYLTKEELYRYPLVMLSPEFIGRSYQGMIEHAQLDGYYPHIQQTASDMDSEFFTILTENLIGFVPENFFPEEYAGQMRRIPIPDTNHRFRLEMKYFPGENSALELFVKELSNYLKTK